MPLSPSYRPVPLAPRFGTSSYGDILSAFPAVPLTPEQQRITDLADSMATAPKLKKLAQYVDMLASPSYEHVINIAIRFRPDKSQNKRREPFHSPFTDLFLSLKPGKGKHQQVLNALEHALKNPANGHVTPNATKALADIYFYAVAPDAKAFDQYKKSEATQLQGDVLQHLQGLIQNPSTPLQARRLLKNELAIALRYSHKTSWSTSTKRAIETQLGPLLATSLPRYTPPLLTQPDASQLVQLIRSADIQGMRQFSTSGRLAAVVPQWARLAGADRYQHETQDFELDEHTLRVFDATPRSRFFGALTPHEKFLTMTAALFHDITKRTGPKTFWDGKRITPDPTHPPRCAETSLEILPTLGYTPQEVDDLHTLIDCHSELGDNVNPNAPATVSSGMLKTLAGMIGKKSILKMLMALTEGDIRSVKNDVPGNTWYTPGLDQRLQKIGHDLDAMLPA